MTTTPEVKKIQMTLRCNLTDEEKLESGRELAEATNELSELESQKSEVVSEFKAKTTAVESRIGVIGNKLRSGYEFRQVDCEVRFDQPVAGKKTIVRVDTDQQVEVRDMTEEEKQLQLPGTSEEGATK